MAVEVDRSGLPKGLDAEDLGIEIFVLSGDHFGEIKYATHTKYGSAQKRVGNSFSTPRSTRKLPFLDVGNCQASTRIGTVGFHSCYRCDMIKIIKYKYLSWRIRLKMRFCAPSILLGPMILATLVLTVLPGYSQDLLGIYWDEGFSARSAICTTPNQILEGYLVIEEPSAEGGILGWECEVILSGPAIYLGWSFPAQSVNLETPPRFHVGFQTPLPPGQATAVASFQLMVTEVEPVWLGAAPLADVWPERPMSYWTTDQPEIQIPLSTPVMNEFIANIYDQLPVFLPEPAAFDFGHVAIGESRSETIHVTNAGEDMILLDPFIDCPSGDWGSNSILKPTILRSGHSLNFNIQFNAETLGESNCSFHFGPQLPTIPLSADVGEPRYDWETSEPLEFDLDVGRSVYKSIYITNTGDFPLELDVGLSGDTEHFQITSGAGPRYLYPPHTHYARVDIQSWTPGEFRADVDFGPDLPSIPIIATVAYQSPPECGVSEDSLDFGFHALGSTTTLNLYVSNIGGVEFAIIPTVEPAGTAFSLEDEGIVIPVTGDIRHVRLPVDFTPASEGHQEATLILGEGLPIIPLSGQGAFAGYRCGVQPDTFNFGTIEVGAWVQGAFRVWNEGSLPLALSPQSNSPKFLVDGRARNLDAGDSAVIQLRLASEFVGDFVGVVDLGPDACSELVVIGSVTDTGVPVALPSPAVLVDQRVVELRWTPHLTEVDGYHVWRRGPDDQSLRLTAQPLEPRDRMYYADEPPLAPGTAIHYSYSAILDGEEVGRSPETTVSLTNVPAIRTRLIGAAPNPFNPETTIHFAVGRTGPVRIAVYDMTGRLLRTLVDRVAETGELKARWDGKDETGRRLPSGPYIIRLETVDLVDSQKITLLK